MTNKISKRSLVVPVAMLVMFSVSSLSPNVRTTDERLEVKMCDFQVPPELARANATFSVFYEIQVGDDGRPTKIEKVKNNLLGNEPFVECIQSWTLSVKNKRLVASFDWKHGQGWTGLTILGDGLQFQVAFDPGAFSQYGRATSGK
jgi:hypothetical protein